ncbi:HAMP domain-containing histidine kinase [Donghicola sp. C2-DW-16]|uniref:histidine kinase n=1 Tax=Donghicola mangrovi TaxID=2729614 RepID=A0ABX2PEX5_9RHOB|nr:HAMP domain-containing histidine kinase [Donghicola mangrovi]
MDRHHNSKFVALLANALTWLVLLLCSVVMLGWILDLPALVKPIPNSSPTQVTTALSLGLCALSPILLRRNIAPRWATAPYALAIVIAGLSALSYWFEWANFINELVPSEVLERGAKPGQMSLMTALLLISIAGYGITYANLRATATLTVLGQAILVTLLGVTITFMGLQFSDLSDFLHVHGATGPGIFTIIGALCLILTQVTTSSDEHGLYIRLTDMTEVVATGIICGVVLFYGVVATSGPRDFSQTNLDRMAHFIEHRTAEIASGFHDVAAETYVPKSPDRAGNASYLRACRNSRDTLVLSISYRYGAFRQVDCAYSGTHPSPGGSIYAYFENVSPEWGTNNPTATGSLIKYCDAETRCQLYATVATYANQSQSTMHLIILNVGLALRDFLAEELVVDRTLADQQLYRWISTLSEDSHLLEALASFDTVLAEAGFSRFQFKTQRIQTATEVMTFLLLAAVLTVFVLMQINQRTFYQFREASRQLSIRQYYSRRFVYAAAHDLRAPLRGIEQLSSWAKDDLDDNDTEAASRYMGLINSRIHHLSRLIEGILDLARLENRESQIEYQPLANAIEAAANLYRSPNIRIDTTYSPTNLHIQYEYDGLVRVLNNLIANAVSHHDKDEVYILISSNLYPDRVRILIEDNGPGIPESRHEMIFELFRSYSNNQGHTGVGMGLSMVRRLVEEWGGSIGVVSPCKMGRGARFEIEIPLDLVWKRGG